MRPLLPIADGTTTVPAAPTPAPGASWLTPGGLDAMLTLCIVLAALIGRLTGRTTEAKKATDLLTIARSYTATVKGVQSFRELATPDQADKLLALIESATASEGVEAEHHAAVHAITEGAAPMPEVAPGAGVEKVLTSDPIAAVKAATARLARRVA